MHIALTGTPGVGKTQSSSLLKKRGYSIIDLNQLALSRDYTDGYDKERDSHIIDLEALDSFIKKEYHGRDMIIEGHLSHLLSVDMAVILRCNPLILRERLTNKGWNEGKVTENVQAEILDVVKIEAHEHIERVYEIDTTNRSPEEVADLFDAVIHGESTGDETGWLEEFEYLLFQ